MEGDTPNVINLCAEFHHRLNVLDPKMNIWQDPRRSVGMRPEEYWIRNEIRFGRYFHLKERRLALAELLHTEAVELLKLKGLAFMPTQP